MPMSANWRRPRPVSLRSEPVATMTLRLLGYAHRSKGGFDHADVHSPTDRIYVAHTANDSIDVIDCDQDRYVESITGLTAVAGALVSEIRNLVFITNRGENTVSVFAPGHERDAFKVAVGVKPNGVAFDSDRNLLVVANVGDPAISVPTPRQWSTSGAKSVSPKSKYPAAPAGRPTARHLRRFSSISHLHHRSSRLMRVTRPRYRMNIQCRPTGRMVSNSTRRRAVCSVPAMRAFCSQSTQNPVASSAREP